MASSENSLNQSSSDIFAQPFLQTASLLSGVSALSIQPNSSNSNAMLPSSTLPANATTATPIGLSPGTQPNLFPTALTSQPMAATLPLTQVSGKDALTGMNTTPFPDALTVGADGQISSEYLFDGGQFAGQLGIFSLEGMEKLQPNSLAFMQEAARRVLSDSSQGHLLISDIEEGAKFGGHFASDAKDYNQGAYKGIKTVSMRPGDRVAVMFVPNGRVQLVYDNPKKVGGSTRPMFSIKAANLQPNHPQLVDLTGEGCTLAFEDSINGDNDYNDVIFTLNGVSGALPIADGLINPKYDWRTTPLGQQILQYACPTPPKLNVSLLNDTAPSHTTNTDRITSDPTITGSVTTVTPLTHLYARLNTAPSSAAIEVNDAVQADGTFRLDLARLKQMNGGTLPDGQYTLSLDAVNQRGIHSAPLNFTFTLDTTPEPATFDLEVKSDTDVIGDHTTTLSPVTLAGKTTANTIVQLLEPQTQTTSDANGNFSFAGIGLQIGQNTFHVKTIDVAGNEATFAQTITRVNDGITLTEGKSFEVKLDHAVDLTKPSVLTFQYNAAFDTSDPSDIKDAFEVALVDDQGHSLTQPFQVDRDAFFNLTEGQSAALGANAQLVGNQVQLTLPTLPAGKVAHLVFRLVNNDKDTLTTVQIQNILVQLSATAPISASVVGAKPAIAPIDLTQLSDVTPSVQIQYGRTSFDDQTKDLYSTVHLTNQGQYEVRGPLAIVVKNISDPSVRVIDADGTTPDGLPYYTVSPTSNSLTSGQSSIEHTLAFYNPKGVQFTYDVQVLAHLNRPPVITSTPGTEALLGHQYTYTVAATDPDNDTLSYKLLSAPQSMAIDAQSGQITWTLTTGDLGNQSITVQVQDGHGGQTQQTFTLSVVDGALIPNRPPIITSTPVVNAQVSQEQGGRIIVANDDWTLSDSGFSTAPADTAQFVKNIADYFTNGKPGKFLGYSDNFGVTGQRLAQAFQAAGQQWTTTTSANFDLKTLQQYDGVFVGGFPVDNQVLIDYVKQGGNVYLFAGTGAISVNGNEANAWAPFLNAFGLSYDANYNGIGGAIPIDSAPNPIFKGISQLYELNGNSVIDLDVNDSRGVIVARSQTGQGLYAVYDPGFAKGKSYEYDVKATDPDYDIVSYALAQHPDGMWIDPKTGVIRWSPAADQVGTHQVIVKVTDSRGGSAEQPFTVAVRATAGNHAPIIVSDAISTADSTRPYTYQVQALDADKDKLTYSLTTALTGMQIDPLTGRISWNTPVVQTKPYDVTVQVVDGKGGVDTQSYQLTVTNNPTAEISGIMWNDSNANGVQDSEEQGLAGVKVYLDLNNNQAFDLGEIVTTTDQQGMYRFTNLVPSTYTVRELLPEQLKYTFPAAQPLLGQNLIQNGSFEQGPSYPYWQPVYAGSTVIPDWNVKLTSVDYCPDTLWQASDGHVSIDLDGTPGPGGIAQTINTIPGQKYLVTFDLSAHGYLYSGTTRQMTVTAAGQSAEFTGIAGTTSNMQYKPHQWQFTAAAPTTEIGFYSYLGDSYGPVLDNVTVRPITDSNDFSYVVPLAAGQVADHKDFGNQWIVNSPVNQSPTMTTTSPSLSAVVGEVWRYQAQATDPNFDALTYDLPVAPDGMVVDSKTGLVVWKPTIEELQASNSVYLDSGSYNVLLRVQDGHGGVDLQSFQVRLKAASIAPTFSTVPPKNPAVLNHPFEYTVKAQTAANSTVTYSLDTSAPVGASIDPTTGVFTWKPTVLEDNTFKIIATDSQGNIASQTFTLQVVSDAPNQAPVITSAPRIKTAVGQSYLYQVVATDPNNDALTYRLVDAPAGMTIDNTGKVIWTPQAAQLGANAVTVQVDDGRGGVQTQAFQLQVLNPVNLHLQAPQFTSTPTSLQAIIGQQYRYTPTISDPDHDLIGFTLDQAPPNMVVDPATGTILWTPTADQTSAYPVVLRVIGSAGNSTETFTLQVQPVATPPMITSTPLTQAAVGKSYQYLVQATDAAQSPLSYALVNPPQGMTIDAQTGIIQWTPGSNQVGNQSVQIQVADSFGLIATQNYTLVVSTTAANLPPAITSQPLYAAAVGQSYQYQVKAQDPEGATLTYSLQSAPAGMTINAQTGLIQWTPTTAQVGAAQVKVVTTDAEGAAAVQGFTITAIQNHAPVLSGQPTTQTTVGQTYRFDVQATDSDQDPLTYRLDQAPNGMTIDNQGRVTWTPTSADAGQSYPITVTVQDNHGAAVQKTLTLSVVADTEAPKVQLFATQSQADVGSTVDLIARATDNVKVANLTLMVDGQAVALDANGKATIHLDHTGIVNAIAMATDAAGNRGQGSTTVQVIDPTATFNPTFDLDLSNLANGTITAPTQIHGTVSGDGIDHYELAIAPVNSDTFKTIASGSSAVTNGVLGTVDPTLLQNDSYTLRLIVYGKNGSSTYTENTIGVAGDLKLGNFKLSFTDLSLPGVGIPITMTRTYDSLTAGASEDFGYGWRMDFRNTDLRTSLKRDPDLEAQGLYQPFKSGTRVYITLPGGKREGFTFKPTPDRLNSYLRAFGGAAGADAAMYHPAFESDKGVTDTLTVDDARILSNADTGEYNGLAGTPYNPIDPYYGGVYKLTTKEGIVYRIDAQTGKLLTVSDPNGNTLTYTDNDITSSSGQRITFDHDAQGRITTVTDPSGKQIHYAYNDPGDLVSVTDREGNTTQFKYDQARLHYLQQVIDPLGRVGAKTEYDSVTGQLKQIVDASGKVVAMSYDPTHSTETVTDQLGNPTTYEYDDRGNVVNEVDAVGKTTKRTYDDNNNVLSETVISDRSGPNGFTTTYTYDAKGNKTSETDPLGNTTYDSYDSKGHLLTETDALGRTTTNLYDSNGNLLSTKDAIGNTSTYAYDSTGLLTSVADANGKATSFTYDAYGNVQTVTDALGNATSYQYDTQGNKLSETHHVTLVSGQVQQDTTTSWTYDNSGHMTSMTDAEQHKTSYEYDADGHQTVAIDALRHRTESHYDEKGNLIETDYADQTKVQYRYDAAGRKIAEIDQAGRETRFVYDAAGRLITTIEPDATPNNWDDNPRMQTEYYTDGLVKAQIDELGHRTQFQYDADGRQTAIVAADGSQTQYEYDKAGEQTAVTDALNHRTSYVYDDLGRLAKTTSADGTSTSTEYDKLGRRTAAIDQNGKRTEYQYDDLGRLTGVKDALGNVTSYRYNEAGNLMATTDANGHTTQYEYDRIGHRTATLLPLGQRSTTAYDAVGNTQAVTDFNGQTITYDYDVLNRLSHKHFQDSSQTSYVYTATGQQASITDANGTISYQYDERGRMVSRTDADGATIAYTYDLAGDRTSVTTTLPGQTVKTTSYSFDNRNRLASVIDPSGGTTSYTYDADSNLTRTVMANGGVETRSYDALNHLTHGVNQDSKGTTISSFHYTLDKAGNRTQVKEANGRQVDYSYDDLYRLTEEKVTDAVNGDQTDAYAYDNVGNRLTKTETITSGTTTTSYEYDANDRLLDEKTNGQTSTTYTYDANGSTLSKKDATGETDYVWNQEKRLIGATVKDAQGQTQQQMQYRYNDAGIRTASITNGQETRYLLDEVQPYTEVLEEYTLSGTQGVSQVSYVYGNRLISQAQSGATTYYLVDGLGSTTELTDASGTVVNRSRYDAFGEITDQTGNVYSKYLFAGEQFDEGLGDYYLRQRYYDTSNGRFGRMDDYEGRLGEPATLQKYVYANGSPINYIDPTGYSSIQEGDWVHNIIGAHFIQQVGIQLGFPLNPRDSRGLFTTSRVFDPRFPLNVINIVASGSRNRPTFGRVVRTALQSPNHPGVPGINGKVPDLVDFSSKEFYEIKPNNAKSIQDGQRELQTLDSGFQAVGLSAWGRGYTYAPLSPFVLPNSNIVLTHYHSSGLIVYDILNTRLALTAIYLTARVLQAAIAELITAITAASARPSAAFGV